MVSNPKENTVQVLRDNRWVRRGGDDSDTWMRPARGDGHWRLILDYTDPEGWRGGTTNRLVAVDLRHFVREGDVEATPLVGNAKRMLMHRPDGHGGYSASETWLWRACGLDARGEVERSAKGRERILRVRAEILIKNPDLAVWVAAVLYYKAQQAKAARDAERKAAAEARAKPFPLTVTQGRYDSEWERLVKTARNAISTIDYADGTQDMRALVCELIRTTNAIKSVVVWEDGVEDDVMVRPVRPEWGRRQLDL